MAAEIISAVAGFFVALLVIVDLIFNGSSRVAKLRDVNQKLAGLEADYRFFWEKVREGAIDNLDAIEIKNQMSQQRVEYEAFVAMSPNVRLNRIAQRQAFKVEEQRYAAAGLTRLPCNPVHGKNTGCRPAPPPDRKQ